MYWKFWLLKTSLLDPVACKARSNRLCREATGLGPKTIVNVSRWTISSGRGMVRCCRLGYEEEKPGGISASKLSLAYTHESLKSSPVVRMEKELRVLATGLCSIAGYRY
jgi:hypothetical protein